MTEPLYNIAILRLAASIPFHERLPHPDASIEKRSPVCGSRITVDVTVDPGGRLLALGQQVQACALGQASASLMATHAIGKSAEELEDTIAALGAFLAGSRKDPGDWPGLKVFSAARPHSARHASILLPFEAVAQAMRSIGKER